MKFYRSTPETRTTPLWVLVIFCLLAFALSTIPTLSSSATSFQHNRTPADGTLIYDDTVQTGWTADNIGFVDINEFSTAQVFA